MENLDLKLESLENTVIEQEQPGLDDKSTIEIMRLIEDLKDDIPTENVKNDNKSATVEVNPTIDLNENQMKQLYKKPFHLKKSSDLIRWKVERISDLLENYISFREAQNWN